MAARSFAVLAWLLVALIWTVAPQLALAQEAAADAAPADTSAKALALEPLVVFSLSNYQNLLDDLKYIAKVADDDRFFEKSLPEFLSIITQDKTLRLDQLEGIDTARPWGATLVGDGPEMRLLAFVPISGEAEQVAEQLQPLWGDAEAQEAGVFAVNRGALKGFVKVADGNAWLAQSREHLELLPEPAAVLGNLPTSYDGALQINLQKVPEELRSLLADQVGAALESVSQQADGESDAAYAFRQEIGRVRSTLMSRASAEAESVTFGWNIDSEAKKFVGEVLIKPIAGSSLASHFASDLKNLKSRFGGVLTAGTPKPQLMFNLTGKLESQTAADALNVLEKYRGAVLEELESSTEIASDEERQTLQDLANGFLDVARGTIESGELDVAVRISTGVKPVMIAAAKVAQPDDLAKLFATFGELAAGDKGFASAKLNEAEHNGSAIHSLTFKADTDQIKFFERMFGKATLYVTVKGDTAWLAAGETAIDELKKALDGEEVDVQPMQATMQMGPMIVIAAQLMLPKNLTVLGTVLSMQLTKEGRADMVAEVTPDGSLRMRTDAEQGFYRMGVMIMKQVPGLIELQRSGRTPGSGGPF
ncbi:MAG: hypothetical protein AB7O68_06580 [Pirellulales bacterium]